MYRSKKGITCRIILITAVVLLFLSGCGSKENQEPIKVVLYDDVVSLDTSITKDIISEAVNRCIFATLYIFDENMDLIPCLAEKSEQVSDLEWVFYLQEKAVFQDGTPITASDVKFSLERSLYGEKPDNSLAVISSMEVLDDHTIKMCTDEPIYNLPSLMVRSSTSVMSKKAVEAEGYDFNKPVGSGPFQVIERIEGQEIKLKRFDRYFAGPAASQYLTFVIEPSEQNSTASLLNGTGDVIFRVSAKDGDYLKLNDDVAMYETESSKMELIQFNVRQEPLQDIRIRKAIACAINKQNIVDNVLDGYGSILNGMIPKSIDGYIDYNDYTYDTEKATELLQEAGYADGFDLTVLTFDEQRKKLMEYLKMDLAKVNIRLNYEFLDLKEYLEIVQNGEQMASIMSWTSNPDPDTTFTQLYSNAGNSTVNQSQYTTPEVEALLQQGRTEKDTEKRRRIYEEANKIVSDSYYIIPIYQPSVLVAARKDIEGVQINYQGLFGFESLYRTNK